MMSLENERERVDGSSQAGGSTSTGSRQKNGSSGSSRLSKVHPDYELRAAEGSEPRLGSRAARMNSSIDMGTVAVHSETSVGRVGSSRPGRPHKYLRRAKSDRGISPRFAGEVDQDSRGQGSNSLFSGFRDLQRSVQRLRVPEGNLGQFLTSMDLDTIDQLGRNFNRSFEKHKIQEESRKLAVRQNMFIVAGAVVVLQAVAIVVLIFRGGLSVPDAILFALYTTTTAGFGSVEIPFDPDFLIFVIFYVFASIATLTMLVAEVYMYIAIKTSAVKKNQDQDALVHLQQLEKDGAGKVEMLATDPELAAVSTKMRTMGTSHTGPACNNVIFRVLWHALNACKSFYRKNEFGRVLIVVLYLGAILLWGIIGMMILEGWTFVEALYFSTFVMTTVGYGDYAPTKQSSTWFVISWIAFNVSFVSIYMGNLSRHYRMLCKANTNRLCNKLREEHFGTVEDFEGRVEKTDILSKGHETQDLPNQTKLESFKDVYKFVLQNTAVRSTSREAHEESTSQAIAGLMTMSLVDSSKVFEKNQARIPSFAILVLVQERVANIIAHDVAGCQSDVVAKDTTLAVSFDDILETAREWLIPIAAQEAFCHSAFEAILYVGECQLVNFGADALTKLPPAEVLDILSPFLAALADGGTMAGWLACTEELASLKFPRTSE